ncbi:FtsX-like permease family protein [Actinosynnema sp. NPDC020468]|uniref:ABC transporter permease n=1 Tax=Actinosynnema sp. NPDC020468 TaxID=3154488 RepID=UPI0033D55E79
MSFLAWQTIRTRLSGFVGAFIAILFGTALVAGCGILMESGIRAGVPTQRYAAAAVVVGGDQNVRPPNSDALTFATVAEQPALSASLVDRIAAVPGVRVAVPEQSFAAHVLDAGGQVVGGKPSLGHGWESAALAPFTLRDGHEPQGDDQVVLDAEVAARAGVHIGQQVRVVTRSTPLTFEVVGIATTPAGDGFTRQSSLFFSTARAAALAENPDRVNAIGVLADQGVDADGLADRVEEALDGEHVTVASGIGRSSVEFLDVGQTRVMLMAISGSFGGYAMMVAIFVVASTLALTIGQRRREFALLRAIAATPRQIRKLIAVETMAVAVVAGLAGSALGVAVGFGLRDAFAAIGVIPDDFALALSPIPLAAAFVIGLLSARLAAWSAARRPSSINPVEALGEAAVERKRIGPVRTGIGWGLLVAGVGLATVPLYSHGEAAMAMSVMSSLVFIIGLSLLGGKVTGFFVRVLAPVLSRVSRVGGYLAAHNTRANTRRLAAAVTPLMLAVGFALVNYYSQTTSQAAVQRETARTTTADYVLTGATGGVPPEVARAARQVPGVSAASSQVRTVVMSFEIHQDQASVDRSPAQGVTGDQVAGVLDLGVTSGDLRDLTGDTVALSEGQAGWLDKKIGDEVEFAFGDGAPAKLRLVATYAHDLAFGDYVLPADLARAHTTNRVDTAVLVRTDPSADPAAVRTALEGLAGTYPGLSVADGASLAAPDDPVRQSQFWLNLVAVGVILGYVAISVANTLVMSTAQRGREFALLRLIGATRRQVVRMMRIEAVVTVGIAILLGSLLAALPLAMLGIGFIGSPVLAGPLAVYLGVVGGAALLGFLSLGVATRVSLRARPIDAIGLRE